MHAPDAVARHEGPVRAFSDMTRDQLIFVVLRDEREIVRLKTEVQQLRVRVRAAVRLLAEAVK